MKSLRLTRDFLLLIFLAILLPACLKTRAQLKQDGDLSSSVNAAEPTPVGQSYAIDEIKGEMVRLSGRLDEIERKVGPEAASESKQEILEKRLMEVEKTQLQILETLKSLESQMRDPDSVFQEGRSHLEQGRLNEAIANFGFYLKREPTGKNAAEASFLRGEANYRLGKFSDAILDYTRVENQHRKSPFIASALYKMGLSYESLGEKSVANGYYEELVAKHGSSSYAQKAKGKLNYNKPKKRAGARASNEAGNKKKK